MPYIVKQGERLVTVATLEEVPAVAVKAVPHGRVWTAEYLRRVKAWADALIDSGRINLPDGTIIEVEQT